MCIYSYIVHTHVHAMYTYTSVYIIKYIHIFLYTQTVKLEN